MNRGKKARRILETIAEHIRTINIAPDPITAENAENWFGLLEEGMRHTEHKGLLVTPAGIPVILRGPRKGTHKRVYFFTCGPVSSPKRETFDAMNADLQAFLAIVTKGVNNEGDCQVGSAANLS